jgi:hypothetical protein
MVLDLLEQAQNHLQYLAVGGVVGVGITKVYGVFTRSRVVRNLLEEYSARIENPSEGVRQIQIRKGNRVVGSYFDLDGDGEFNSQTNLHREVSIKEVAKMEASKKRAHESLDERLGLLKEPRGKRPQQA